MPYRWADHTSELELELEGETEEAVFLEALAAFRELAGDRDGADDEHRTVEVHGGGRATLLVAWLEELALLAEMQRFVPERVTELELGAASLRAAVRGHVGDPRHLVKAVTLHRLRFERVDEGWRARVVLDV